MANWAIAIGVNQYEFLHHLKYAKNDALHICQFLGNEAKFDRIFCFSDDSPDLDGKTTKPFRNNLLKVFKELFAQPFLNESDNFSAIPNSERFCAISAIYRNIKNYKLLLV